MKNPLSDLEKRILLQHLNHDIRNALNNLRGIFTKASITPPIEVPRWGSSNVIHIKNSIAALEQLTADKVYLGKVTSKDINSRLIENRSAVRRKNDNIHVNVNELTDFSTQLDVLGLAMYTLLGNSAMQVAHGKGEITITAQDYHGDISDLVYKNPASPVVGEFKRFRIQDSGQGFPFETKFLQIEEADMPKEDEKKHFGLRLTRVICKYLMCHFAIAPKVDEHDMRGADLSIYHPQDIEPLYEE